MASQERSFLANLTTIRELTQAVDIQHTGDAPVTHVHFRLVLLPALLHQLLQRLRHVLQQRTTKHVGDSKSVKSGGGRGREGQRPGSPGLSGGAWASPRSPEWDGPDPAHSPQRATVGGCAWEPAGETRVARDALGQPKPGGTHPVPAIGAGAHQIWPTPRPSGPDTSQIRRTVSQMRLRARLCPQKNVDPEAGQSYTILGSETPPHAERRPFSLGLKLGLDAARCLRFRFCTCAVGRLKEQALWAEAGKFRAECWKRDRCKEWRVACFEGLGMSPGKSRSQLFSLYCVFHCGSPSKCVCVWGGSCECFTLNSSSSKSVTNVVKA